MSTVWFVLVCGLCVNVCVVCVCVCVVCMLVCVNVCVCVCVCVFCVGCVCMCVYDEICQSPPGSPEAVWGCVIPSDTLPPPPVQGAPRLSPRLPALPPG